MAKVHVYLDAGHGGIDPNTGEYVTPGKRSPNWHKGVLYEGVFNRDVCDKIAALLYANQIPYTRVYHPWQDTPLSERVARANAHDDPDTVPLYVSVHANAGGGDGIEVYTYPGESLSDKAASYFIEACKRQMPAMGIRADYSDGDADKEREFYVLKHTNCAAILTENGFMDNLNDYEALWMNDYRQTVATCHMQAINTFYDDIS